MNDAPPPRSGRAGGIFVALVVLGSAIGVIGWYVLVNRTGPVLDATGFDLSVAPQSPRSASSGGGAVSSPSRAPSSSLGMLKAEEGIRVGDSSAPGARAAAPKEGDKKEQARADFKEQARKHEADVRKFAERMTRRYPLIRQYGKDWMSHPDLKKLNDDYMRDRDPVAFVVGLAKAPSLGAMVKKYAGSPEIISFITEGMKEAPADLTSAGMDVLSKDGVVKSLVANVANGLGLPPSITGLINSGGDASKLDQKRILSEIENSPAARNALEQGQQTAPVPLNQR